MNRGKALINPAEEPRFCTPRWHLFAHSALNVPARPSRLSAFWQQLLPALLAIVGFAGFFAYWYLGIPKVLLREANLKTMLPVRLSVAERQKDLEVTWDRNAPAIVQAKRGVLSITDGWNKRYLEFSGAQLRTGRVLYSPLSNDVSLRLEVFAGGGESLSESIRIYSESANSRPALPPMAADRASRERPKEIAPRRALLMPGQAAPPSNSDPVESAPKATTQKSLPEVELRRPAPRR